MIMMGVLEGSVRQRGKEGRDLLWAKVFLIYQAEQLISSTHTKSRKKRVYGENIVISVKDDHHR
jgi:hypothetical protein